MTIVIAIIILITILLLGVPIPFAFFASALSLVWFGGYDYLPASVRLQQVSSRS